MMKTALRYLGILAIGVAVGFVLLLAVYCIPDEWVQPQVKASHAVFEWEGDYPDLIIIKPRDQVLDKSRVSILDNRTDSLMVATAGFAGGKNLVKQVVDMPHPQLEDASSFDSFLRVYDPENTAELSDENTASYARYWHGYTIILRPLLMLLDYAQIRSLNAAALSLLLIAVLYLMMQRRSTQGCVIPLLLTAALMIPSSVAKSLHFSNMCYVALIAMLVLLTKRNAHSEWYRVYFLLIGMAVGYFDLLTAPVITLCLPLSTVLVMESQKPEGRIRLQDVLCCILLWGVGYGGMWASKWFVAFLYDGMDFVTQTLMPSIAFRSSAVEHVSRLEPVVMRFKQILSVPVTKMFAFVLCLFTGVLALRTAISCRFADLPWHLLFVLVALIPFGWTFVMSNHSYIHFFTYRTFAPVFYVVPVAFCAYAANDRRLDERV